MPKKRPTKKKATPRPKQSRAFKQSFYEEAHAILAREPKQYTPDYSPPREQGVPKKIVVRDTKGYKQFTRKQSVTLLVRTAWSKPGKQERKEVGTEKRRKGKGTFTRDIDLGSVKLKTKLHYVKITPAMIREDSIKEILRKYIKKEQRQFDKSTFNSFRASTQIISGGVVDPFTSRVRPNGKVSKASYLPTYSKKRLQVPKGETKPRKMARSKKDLKIIGNNNLIDMLENLDKLFEYGWVKPHTATQRKEYYARKKAQRKTEHPRQTKHNAENDMGEEESDA